MMRTWCRKLAGRLRVVPPMKIGEAAKASGLSVRTLRFYEDEGLCVPPRAHNGYREYCEWGLQRIQVIAPYADVSSSRSLPDVTGSPRRERGRDASTHTVTVRC